MKPQNKEPTVVVETGERESNIQKKSRFIVNMVNPRFQNYNRPLLLALLVGFLTFFLMILTFIMMMAAKPKRT